MDKKQESVTQTEDKIEGTVTESVEKAEKKEEGKTFTQEEVNAMILKAENKATKKYEGVDLKKYKEWEESQKTETEKQQEKDKKHLETENELNETRKELLVYKAGVQEEDDVDYILFKVSKMEGDFDENLKEFLEKNPKYLKKEKNEGTNETTGVAVAKGTTNVESGVRKLLKEKHPNIKF